MLFPRDFLVNGIHSTNHAMLGLGDIVLPGIIIALLLRFDRRYRACLHEGWRIPQISSSYPSLAVSLLSVVTRCCSSRKPRGSLYFTATFIAYIVGLVTTIAVMHTFKAAQVNLSAACFHALVRLCAVSHDFACSRRCCTFPQPAPWCRC